MVFRNKSKSINGAFEEHFLQVLEDHAPIKNKKIRSNQSTYITKALRKAIMKQGRSKVKISGGAQGLFLLFYHKNLHFW